MAHNKPTAARLRAQVQEAETLLESKKAELSRTLETAEAAGIDAIVTGKENRAPALPTKPRLLKQEVATSEDGLQALDESAGPCRSERGRHCHRDGAGSRSPAEESIPG